MKPIPRPNDDQFEPIGAVSDQHQGTMSEYFVVMARVRTSTIGVVAETPEDAMKVAEKQYPGFRALKVENDPRTVRSILDEYYAQPELLAALERAVEVSDNPCEWIKQARDAIKLAKEGPEL